MKKLFTALTLVTGLAVTGTGAFAGDDAAKKPTADNQAMNKSDAAVTANIRRAIVKDKTLSTLPTT